MLESPVFGYGCESNEKKSGKEKTYLYLGYSYSGKWSFNVMVFSDDNSILVIRSGFAHSEHKK